MNDTELILSLEELSRIVGCATTTLRSWLGSYKFNNSLIFSRVKIKGRASIHIKLSSQFCRIFAKYLTGRKKHGRPDYYLDNFFEYCSKKKML